jgi:hypothetical protein
MPIRRRLRGYDGAKCRDDLSPGPLRDKWDIEVGYTYLPSSRYSHADYPHGLLDHDEPPSADIADSYLRDVLDRTQLIRQKLDRQMKALRRKLEEIDNFERVQRKVLGRIVSPIQSIPMELLMEILLHTCGYYYDSNEADESMEAVTTWTNRGPWTYAQVNKAFREACLSLPILWSNIVITDYRPRKLEVAQELLSRSGTHYLNVTFYHQFGRYDGDDASVETVVCKQSHRWRKLLFMESESRSTQCERLTHITDNCDLSSLQSIEIRQFHARGDSWGQGFSIDNAPQLRRVRTALMPAVAKADSPLSEAQKSRWNQVTHFSWGSDNATFQTDWYIPIRREEELDFLRLLPSLIEYRTIGSRGSIGPNITAEPPTVTLKYLKKLVMFYFTDAIPYLRLPAVEIVRLSHCKSSPRLQRLRLTEPLEALHQVLRRSECQLKELDFEYYGSFEDQTLILLEVLKLYSCRSLTNLHIKLDDYDARLIGGLNLTSLPSLLPCLRTLRIENDLQRDRFFNAAAIVDMVRSRESFLDRVGNQKVTSTATEEHSSLSSDPPPRNLESFHYTARIFAHQHPSSDTFQPLNELREAGMDVEFGLGVYDERFTYDEDENGKLDYILPSDSEIISEPEEEYYASDIDGWHESDVSDEDHDDAEDQSENEDSSLSCTDDSESEEGES